MSDDTALARSLNTSPIGKLTEPVGPFKIPVETKEILEQEARRAGMSLNEFLRELAMIRAHGIEVVANLHAARLAVVAGKVEQS